MVSRRNFFSICLMMVVILFLFQFLQVIRDVNNDYDTNDHLSETELTRADSWDQSKAGDSAETVVYVGKSDTLAEIVSQWAVYTKRLMVRYASLKEYEKSGQETPVLVCVAGSEISKEADVNILADLAYAGEPIILCDLPTAEVMGRLPTLRDMLGIQMIADPQTELIGVKMFSGFLLGGEVVYQPTTEKEEKMQDMELSVPWYLLLRNTKTYMVGLLENETVENEYLPPLIWRSSYGSSQIFAVNGSYMYDQTGLGILDAVIYEVSDYELYPIVNAQNLSVVNYPDFALENTDELMKIYARNLRRLQMDLIWPNLIASTNKGNYKMTCFLTPRLDYTSLKDISTSDLVFYLKQLKEQDSEAGLSFDYLSGAGLEEAVKRSAEFLNDAGSEYTYGSAYINKDDEDALAELESRGLLGDIKTVTSVGEATDPILSYCTDTVVDQGVTADGFNHTYLQDLRIRSIETALGYSNIMLDMKNVSWPEEGADHWEVLYEAFSSNINTYWNAFSAFKKTTLSESDERVRNFLSVDYSDVREDDTIYLTLSGRSSDTWFLMRTHSELISGIEGGEYQLIEEHVYMICAQADVVTITVVPDEQPDYDLR